VGFKGDLAIVKVNPPPIQHFLFAKFMERLLDAEINRLGLDILLVLRDRRFNGFITHI
jgi:hypothetical protein